ncbi:MAG: tetratricopeptide repeat-containing glycosyltransferase family protein [Pseudomonadota bacterium]
MSNPAADSMETGAMLKAAVKCHQDGKLSEADRSYSAILEEEPDHADAWHLKGLIAYQSGRFEDAARLIQRAIAVNPGSPEFHNSLGAVQEALGDTVSSIRSYVKAIENRPDYSDAYIKLARLRPDVAEIRFNLACILHRQGNNGSAIEHYEAAVRLQPENVIALNNLGLTLQEMGKIREAGHCYIRAVNLSPDFSEARYNLGRMYQLQGDLENAIEEYRRAIRTARGSSSRIFYNWALALQELGQYDEAIQRYADAVHVDPGYAEARVNRSLLLLLTGRCREAWPEYEWRQRRPDWLSANPVYPDLPPWDGSPLPGKRILVQAEQGFGDTIQFVRYLSLVKNRCGRVILEAPPVLHPLLKSLSAMDEMVAPAPQNTQKADAGVHLLSLPGIFQTTVETIPMAVPYLHAPAGKTGKWHSRISGNGFNIGVVWSGNPAHPENSMRSCDPGHFVSLLSLPSVNLYSLQKGPAADRLRETPGGAGIVDLGPELHDFSDTAAVIMNLDLVISVDTALVHLAGALGKPVWTLRYHQPYWVWGTTGETSAWYPSMRIFRQHRPGDWETVFRRVHHQLKEDVLS